MARLFSSFRLDGARPPVRTERKRLMYSGTTIYGPGPATYGQDRASDWDMETVISEGYERSIWVMKCVEMIAADAARLNFVYRQGDDTLPEHPLYKLLNVKANPHESGRVFKKRLVAMTLLSKRGAFVELVRSQAGVPVRLDLLPPDFMRPIPDESEDGMYVKEWEFTSFTGDVRYLTPGHDVIWVREPHPTDPYSGTTPLEAAGISVELDHLSRLYNVSFIKRDARPGGIVGVDADGLDDDELDRIEGKFAPGAAHAGSLSVIGTGPGGLDYVDTSARPRDMAYAETSTTARDEILAAFGVPQSLMGLSQGHTYENVEQDKYSYWSQRMMTTLDMTASAFVDEDDTSWVPAFDVSKIDALGLPERKRREEARQEWNEGLRSADEYRKVAGLEAFDQPQSRALWISSAKAPVPYRDEDKADLGMDMAAEDEAIDQFTDSPLGGVPGGPQGGEVDPATGEGPGRGQGPAAQAVAEARANPGPDSPQAQVQGQLAADDPSAQREPLLDYDQTEEEDPFLQTKSLGADGWFDPGDSEQGVLEQAVVASLTALLARQRGVLEARVRSPKTRRGTRYWQPADPSDPNVGEDSIVPALVLDAERWEQEVADTLGPVVTPAAAAAGASLLMFLTGDTDLESDPIPVGKVAAVKPITDAAAVAAVMAAVAGMSGWLDEVANDLGEAQLLYPDDVDQVVAAVNTRYDEHLADFAARVGRQVASAAVNAARDRVAQTVVPDPASEGTATVVRTWRTRMDDRVRPAHAEAERQTRQVGEPFEVGGFPMRWPGDPLAPIGLTANCRCWLVYRVDGTAALIGPPDGRPETASQGDYPGMDDETQAD